MKEIAEFTWVVRKSAGNCASCSLAHEVWKHTATFETLEMSIF